MLNHVSYAEKKARVHSIIKLGEDKLQKLAESMVGKSYEVLWESINREGYLTGHTSNFMKVKIKPHASFLPNSISTVVINKNFGPELEAFF